jgi:hypothetical protein
MLECVAQLRFTGHCLGNRKVEDGTFVFVKNPEGKVLFPAAWHHANMRFAAQVLNRYHREVKGVCWDPVVGGSLREEPWYRYYREFDGKRMRYTVHEAFFVGDVIELQVTLPPNLSTDDFMRLLVTAGKYKGLSPFKPGEFGHFSVVEVRRRLPSFIET